jgi:hypothetical protein
MKRSDDYIPMAGEAAALIEERREWMRTHDDIRKTYNFEVTVKAFNRVFNESYVAPSQADAIALCLSQWSLIGAPISEADIKVIDAK